MLGSRKEIVARKCIVGMNVLLGILKELKNCTIWKFFFLSLKLLLARKEIVIWESIIDTEYFYFQCVINNFKIKLLNVIFEQFNVSI